MQFFPRFLISLNYWAVCKYVCMHSLFHSFSPLTHSLSFIHSFTHSLIHSHTHSLIHSFIHTLIHSFTHSFTHSLVPGLRLNFPEQSFPLVFLVSRGNDELYISGRSSFNRNECLMVIDTIKTMLNAGITQEQIGVITPYYGQVQYLLQLAETEGFVDIEISTVDGYQGREKDYIIFSTVRSNKSRQLGFLRDQRRMNVSLTRAKYGMVVIGNPDTLCSSAMWNSYLYYLNRHGLLCEGSLNFPKRSTIFIKRCIFSFSSFSFFFYLFIILFIILCLL